MPRAIVSGGSLAGLFCANLLARARWEVTANERVAGPLHGLGAGIVTHPALFHALREAGVPADAAVGVAVEGRIAYASDGTVAGTLALPQVLTSWSRLYALLRGSLPQGVLREGRAVTAAEQDDAGVTVRFSDSTTDRADLLVGADGLRSVVRGRCLPHVAPRYVGYVAWRGVLAESRMSDATRAALMPYLAFCLPPGEQVLGYPIAGHADEVEAGHRQFNFVWYRPAEETTELRRLQTDIAGRVHADGIPPPLIRPELPAALRAEARQKLAPALAEVVDRIDPLFFQPIQDMEVPALAFGRRAILGDAAFVVRPHPGMGVTKALTATPHDVPAALRAFNAERHPLGAATVAHARRLGAYMQASRATRQEAEAAERHRSVAAVLAETAVTFKPA